MLCILAKRAKSSIFENTLSFLISTYAPLHIDELLGVGYLLARLPYRASVVLFYFAKYAESRSRQGPIAAFPICTVFPFTTVDLIDRLL